MFTGLVEDLGEVVAVDHGADGARLTISSRLTGELREGDSVAVNGVCLTAVGVHDGSFSAEVMNETLRRSSLAGARPGGRVNLELAMRPSDRFGGHIVQGHVDGVGRISAVTADGFARRVAIQAPEEVMRYVVQKGSITVDGVSLTVAEQGDASFTVSLIPETLERTTLGATGPGDTVNLEVDVVAKYIERLVNR